ncbi:aminoacyl-histidine dipeptidase [Ohessyouella blattaphilus]|uniref:Aminoacyl-histidine dipeptidase n=1 Tax=Ohessyouella blattaphilus TaxID=2949333 RepID=A0ABT1EEX9_9FIRM|nr:aminoacyl-histidine dipeptidase [Ohessyouella blattaphilus]MCP1109267.1 aminoacyl-histidine dipeptidase [Ohessyouella blattaphilus]MCR8562661.1 aminoacyl-histidine dipeptidase [Ohessyouella blattaphilus]
MSVLNGYEPQVVFHYFEELNKIPRGTYNCQAVSDYCLKFAKDLGLDAKQDETLNVIVKKLGTVGYENAKPVILQGHLDMVCEKTPESTHDFEKDGIEMYVEDGFVKAKDTTLGADNGIAVAYIMALLAAKDIPHPPLEVLLTADEETGMSGAMGIDMTQFAGTNLINLDSEEEGIITAGCAGGVRGEYQIDIRREAYSGTTFKIKIHGLLGGHSGSDIHLQRGNAHKMMGRLLDFLRTDIDLRLVSVDGGSKDNVISTISEALVVFPENERTALIEKVAKMKAIWLDEFMGDEPGLCVEALEVSERAFEPMTKESGDRVIDVMFGIPNGPMGFSRKLKGLTETSMNTGVFSTSTQQVTGKVLIRSSVESKIEEMKALVKTVVKGLTGATVNYHDQYPAWQFRPESELRDVLVKEYENLFGKTPEVSTIHAGLECGLFVGKNPALDCVSIGPEMFDVHSVNERLSIASTETTWKYLQSILKNLR